MQHLITANTDIDTVMASAIARNATFTPPLPEAEVIAIAKSAWEYTAQGRNWFGRGAVVSSHDEVDELMSDNLDAFALLMKLRWHNWGPTFIVANAMAESLPGGGWDRERFAAARAALVAAGKIKLVKRAHTGSAAFYVWGAPAHQGEQGGVEECSITIGAGFSAPRGLP
jgi:hypothetical protein